MLSQTQKSNQRRLKTRDSTNSPLNKVGFDSHGSSTNLLSDIPHNANKETRHHPY